MQNKSSIVLNMNLNASGFARGIKSVIGSVKNMNESMKDATNSASKMSSVMKGIGSSAIKVGKGLAVAGAAAATAVTALVSKSVGAFADYEQLTGGVETLFGAGGRSVEEYAQSVGKSVSDIQGKYDSLMSAQNVVLENANKAYMTAGMSANEYMDTVTGFSASLISSLGGDTNKAADYANSALVDMSDNANKMGTDMESIKNAYQGFAKQNYTMLDNLKLGYGGTQEEMKRLLRKAYGTEVRHFIICRYYTGYSRNSNSNGYYRHNRKRGKHDNKRIVGVTESGISKRVGGTDNRRRYV